MTLEQEKKLQSYKYAEIQTKDKELGVCEPKRNYTQEFITTIIVCLGFVNNGIQFNWIGPILPQLLSGNFKIHITLEESVWVIGLLHIGAIPGCIVASTLSNRYGRKSTLFMSTIPYIISSFIIIFAENVLHYYIARFILGIGVGAVFSVVPMYISEISSPEIRGILSTSIYMAASVGTLIVFVFGAFFSIITYCSICAIFPILMLILTFYLPETPYFCVMKQDFDRAEKTIQFLRRKSNVQDELKRLIEGFKEETAEKKLTVYDLIRDKTNFKSIIIVSVLLMGQQWTGGTAIFGYSQVILEHARSSISVETCGILIAVMNFLVVFLKASLVDRFGRRRLLMLSGLTMYIPLATLVTYFYLQDFTNIEYTENFRLLPLITIIFYKFAFGMGLHGMAYILLGELFPTSVKAQAASVISVIGSVIGFLANKMYQVMLSEYNYPATFFMFMIILTFALIFFYFMVPETKGLTLEEIQAKLRKSNKK